MKTFTIDNVSTARGGIRQQENLTRALGVTYEKHDDGRYNVVSDIECGNRHISVKSRHFTLMSSLLCEGETTLDGIWNVFARNTVSNEFAYVMEHGTKSTVYSMNLAEFKKFVYAFGKVEKDSAKSGGGYKIRGQRNEKAMAEWFMAMA